MRTESVIKHYRSQSAVASALGIRQSSVAGWGEFPPPLRQMQIQRLSDGDLMAEPEVLARFGVAESARRSA